jgi:chemotaxis protein methyltransferase CheR
MSRHQPTDADGFARVLEFIEQKLDFQPASYNDAYLDRRITARMRRTDVEEYREYRRLLAADPDERTALLDALSINVTGFFRNPEVWDGLRPVFRELTDERRSVRCWSAPCADGREPYSIAMLARDDAAIDAGRLSITATDIDKGALAEAREATYETTRTTDIAEELSPLSEPSAHVDRDDSTFTVRDAVRELVSFERHDLVRGDPRGPFDVALCRNLLIYIDESHARTIFETLSSSIRSGGYLVIGKSETMPRSFRDEFEAIDRRLHLYRRR